MSAPPRPSARATDTPSPSRTEGDINLSPRREAFHHEHLDDPTRELLAADAEAYLHQSLSTPCLNAIRGCEGIYLEDFRGRRIMDFHGNSVHQVGYSHPRVIAAVREQLERMPFCPRRYTNEPAVRLAQKLAQIAPGDLSKVLLAPGGALAMGMALKLVRYATGRFKTISMWDAFHGASLDAISIGGEALFRSGVGPLLPGAEHVPPPLSGLDDDPCVFDCGGDCTLRCADYIEYVMQREGDIAAVIAEPMRCTTVTPPPDGYWQRVREICDRHGALLVFDEIPIGLGRTGSMFYCEQVGVTPDILVIGKGLGGAVMPLAAMIARPGLDVCQDVALGHYTHEKSPLAAAAALATIACIEEDGLLARARELGEHAVTRLHQFRGRCPLVSEVRGVGLQIGVELRRPDGTKAVDEAEAVLYGCLRRGLSFKVSDGNVLTLSPPLVIGRAQLDEALDIVEEQVLRACDKGVDERL